MPTSDPTAGGAAAGPGPRLAHLGDFSDWVTHAPGPRARAVRRPADEVRQLAGRALRAPGREAPHTERALDLRSGRRWSADGVEGLELSWSVGFGPRTQAWLLRPAGAAGPMPGVLALHSHDGYKLHGKEKIADGPDPVPPAVAALREGAYGGRAFAGDLAREGFVVLVHDVLGWGSRRFPLEQMPPLVARLGELTIGTTPPDDVPGGVPGDVALYNAAAWHHENLLAKYATLLGTSYAAEVAREDRIALGVLAGYADVSAGLGAVGLSGGGCRAVLLRATTDQVAAAVVVGMMTTYDALLDHNVVDHTWMLFPDGLAGEVDWPDLAACRAPSPVLVQYRRHDALLPVGGALDAHERLAAHYREAGAPGAYRGEFYDGPHAFDGPMQHAAYAWLADQLLT